jgi:hypothetical protein
MAPTTQRAGGSGGSSASQGINGADSAGGPAVTGTANSITGSSVTYSSSGFGTFQNQGPPGPSGAANRGDASPSSGRTGTTVSNPGGSGIVVIRRLTADSNSTSGSTSIDGLDTVHTFTSDGTYTG